MVAAASPPEIRARTYQFVVGQTDSDGGPVVEADEALPVPEVGSGQKSPER